MKKRAASGVQKQESSLKGPSNATASSGATRSLSDRVTAQLLLPMLQGIAETRAGLLTFVYQQGLEALEQLLAEEAEAIAGPKGKHLPDRTHHHWGTTQTSLPMGGRRIVVERPRIRSKDGHEAALPSVEAFAAADPLPDRVAEQVVLGVSTRGFARSLEPLPATVRSRGTSKSSASRALVAKTTEKVADFLKSSLETVDIIALFLDGIEVAEQVVVVALGVVGDGTKVPLGLWQGSTENAAICTALLQDLVGRGLKVNEPLLCVIDGGKGIRKAVRDVFGEHAVVQRCQVHKTRNVRDHLSESRRGWVAGQMQDAYKARSADVAKRRLLQLVAWLEANGEEGAAASLREGLDETLTVLRLGLPVLLTRTFSTTNPIENLNGTIRRVIRNVKRWRPGPMVRRWTALGIAEAQRSFHRIKGHAHMLLLIRALRPQPATVEAKEKAA
jgi:putative transposase